jgi:hypothetical protein
VLLINISFSSRFERHRILFPVGQPRPSQVFPGFCALGQQEMALPVVQDRALSKELTNRNWILEQLGREGQTNRTLN